MADTLRPFMLALALLNIAFVHLTGVVSMRWLLPLYALTLLSPWLVRLQASLLYRLSWNLTVLGLSGVLLHNALTTGLLHLLEDGLVLATLCQVHLLNNIGARQKPDLLFFNSFLIAFVTSFFSQDAGYSAVFLAYASVLVPSLQLFVVLGRCPAPPPGLVGRVLRDSIPRVFAVLVGTGAVFLLWPRDFHREGWLESRIDFAGTRLSVGFAEEVRLDRTGDTVQSDREVFRVRLRQGDRDAMPGLWRGATFVDFRRNGWLVEPTVDSDTKDVMDHPWQPATPTQMRRPAGTPSALLDVRLSDLSAQRLFLPLHAGEFTVAAPPDLEGPVPRPDATVSYETDPSRDYGSRPLGYRVTDCAPPPPARLSRTAVRRLTWIDRDQMPREVLELARLLRARVPAEAEPAQVAESFREWLAENRRYALPGEKGAARGLVEFLTGVAGGHCEFFATALALMLRSEDIPCRVVTGYLASEWLEQGEELVVRRRHAHAWVEAWLHGRGWVPLDATPAGATAPRPPAENWWDDLRAQLTQWWNAVTGFDEQARADAMAWLRGLPARLALLASGNRVPALAVVLLLAGWLMVRRRHGHPAVRTLRAAARRAGVRPLAGETPRELLARAAAAAAAPARIAALAAAVRMHEAARYGVAAGPR